MFRLVTILCVAAALVFGCLAQTQAANERAYVSGNYFLTIDGVKCGFLKSMSGGGTTAEVIEEPSGPNFFVKKHIGPPKYQDLTLQFGLSMSKTIYQWIADSWQQQAQQRNVKVTALDYQLVAKSESEYIGAAITETTVPACDGSSKEPAYFSITLSPEYSKTTKQSSTAKVGGELGRNEQKVWLPSNFQLQIDGLDCTKVSKIESFTVTTSQVKQELGDARDYSTEPGKIKFPNLTITLAESNSASWAAWHESFVIKGNNDEQQEKEGTLTFLAPNKQTVLMRIKLFNLGIYRLEASKAEANSDQIKRVTAELYCERMEIDKSILDGGIGSANNTQSAATTDQAANETQQTTETQAATPGGECVFGQSYSIRKSQPLNFTLDSASYKLAPVNIAKQSFTANADEKLMVLHFTLENPGNTPLSVRHDSLKIAVTDDAGIERPQQNAWGVDKTQEQAGFLLAPKQKASIYAVVTLPAKGEPSSILIKPARLNDGPDLVYKVSGNVAALPDPFVDKSDPTGATALEEVAAKTGVYYPFRFHAIKLVNMSYKTTPLSQTRLNKNEKLLVCNLVIKNHTTTDRLLRYDVIQPILSTGEGEPMAYKGMLFETTDRPVGLQLQPGNEMKVRLVFLITDGVVPEKLTIQESKSRRYVYAVPQ